MNISFKTTEAKTCKTSNKNTNWLGKGINGVCLWDANAGRDFCVNLIVGMQDVYLEP